VESGESSDNVKEWDFETFKEIIHAESNMQRNRSSGTSCFKGYLMDNGYRQAGLLDSS
jgi:hypothetical protein